MKNLSFMKLQIRFLWLSGCGMWRRCLELPVLLNAQIWTETAPEPQNPDFWTGFLFFGDLEVWLQLPEAAEMLVACFPTFHVSTFEGAGRMSSAVEPDAPVAATPPCCSSTFLNAVTSRRRRRRPLSHAQPLWFSGSFRTWLLWSLKKQLNGVFTRRSSIRSVKNRNQNKRRRKLRWKPEASALKSKSFRKIWVHKWDFNLSSENRNIKYDEPNTEYISLKI